MALGRGSNPVWSFVDLTGHQFDDTFYMFVLQNTLPYLPATVWEDPFGSTPWTNPIQFFANGTLPINVYWDCTVVYRLEFRQGPTQADPLIYLVENYVPGGCGGSGPTPPPSGFAVTTENQITNPQFSLVNFSSPFSLTMSSPPVISVAPGWDLVLAGSGTVALNQVPQTSAETNPTNAPYALQITLTGSWTGTPYLRQRFNQAGMLWALQNVSASITAKVSGLPQAISAQLYDSLGTPLLQLYQNQEVDDMYTEYLSPAASSTMPATINTDTPPDAYIEYRIFIPTNTDIFLTSFQLVVSPPGFSEQFNYEEDTIERQVDHTFHYYWDSLLFQPKSSILTGWDFSLNPWQFTTTTLTNLANNAYTADQTIIVQQNYVASATGNNVSVGQAPAAMNRALQVQAVTATNQFAVIQYIDPRSVRPYWGGQLSALVNIFNQKQSPTSNLRVKMRLIRRTTLPDTVAQAEPIASWTAGTDPVFSSAWTVIAPMAAVNDPIYNLVGGQNQITFDGFNLAAASTDTETLGIVFYTIDNMVQSGTPDYMIIDSISLIPNEFALSTNALTFDETLSGCQYYYEKSYGLTSGTTNLPGSVTQLNSICAPMNFVISGGTAILAKAASFGYTFNTIKRGNPTLTFYSGTTSTPNRVQAYAWGSGTGSQTAEITANSFFTSFGFNNIKGFSYQGTSNSTMTSSGVTGSNIGSTNILYHFTADAKLGM